MDACNTMHANATRLRSCGKTMESTIPNTIEDRTPAIEAFISLSVWLLDPLPYGTRCRRPN
jgi:hypothetical protein